MDSDILNLKQAIIDKLRHNGTLDRIQAELRCAVFLAIESNDDSNELKVDECSKFDQNLGYSIIYHFLRQNRFLATAAVFEKEIHQKIISLEELKKEDATTFCFQFFGDNINLSNLTLTETERTINKIYSTKIGNNETNNINFNFISSLGNDVNAIEKQQIANSESNETLKGIPSDSEISNDENEISNSMKNETRNGNEIQNNRSLEKSNDDDDDNDKMEKYNKGNSSSSRSSTIFEQQQQITTTSPSTTMSKYQQQFTKHITSPSSSYPRKLPPITPILNEPILPTKLPSISSSLNNSSNRSRTVPLSHLLDTVLNSQSSNKSETDEDIVEELITDDLLQSDNNSDTTISF